MKKFGSSTYNLIRHIYALRLQVLPHGRQFVVLQLLTMNLVRYEQLLQFVLCSNAL